MNRQEWRSGMNQVIVFVFSIFSIYPLFAQTVNGGTKIKSVRSSQVTTTPPAIPQTPELNYDKTYWGMTPEQVKAAYPLIVFNSETANGLDKISGKQSVLGYSGKLIFVFQENKLIKVNFIPDVPLEEFKKSSDVLHAWDLWFISTRDNFIRALESKYGPASVGRHTWIIKNMKIEIVTMPGPGGHNVGFIVHYSVRANLEGI